jgi:hypothetical protein
VAPAGDRGQLHTAQVIVHFQRGIGRVIIAGAGWPNVV